MQLSLVHSADFPVKRRDMDRPPAQMPVSLLLLGIVYGGMVTLAGVLGAKQVAMGPLAVEAGIFPFLLLVGISSGVTRLHGDPIGQLFF